MSYPETVPSPIRIDSWNPDTVLSFVSIFVGGVLAGAAIHNLHPLFAMEDLPPIGLGASPELVESHRLAAQDYRSNNYGVALALFGLVTGGLFGAIAGRPRRVISTLSGALAGSITGAAGGFLAGRMVADYLFRNAEQTLQSSMGVQSAVWGCLLAAIVYSCGCVHVGPIRSLKFGVTGAIAGFGAALGQFVISSVMYPQSNPMFVIPEKSSERLIWIISGPLIAGILIALGLRQTDKHPNSLEAKSQENPD